jgi:hypothetical protein
MHRFILAAGATAVAKMRVAVTVKNIAITMPCRDPSAGWRPRRSFAGHALVTRRPGSL